MKRIKFENIQANSIFVILIILSIICLLIGSFELIPFENPRINKYFSMLGFLLQIIFYSRMFWFKNYVQWNKMAILIRINMFLGKSIQFENIEKIIFENKVFTIFDVYKKTHQIDLKEFNENDIVKLQEIFNQNLS